MNIIVEINHPAQVHKLRNLIKRLEKEHNVLVLSRDKECTLQLLNYYQIANRCISRQKKARVWLFFELIQRLFATLFYIIKLKPKVMFGFSAINLCLLGRLLGIRTVLLADTEDAGMISKLTFPFATKIVVPATFKRSFGKKEIRFEGTHEFSYLMEFKPDKTIYPLLGIKREQKYVLLRFVSWRASHDIKEGGLNTKQKKRLIELLEKKFKVFINSEGELDTEFKKYQLKIPPERMHDVIYFADIFIGESQSMSTEAALLGTPSIRFSSLVGKMHGLGQYNELQKNKLVFSTNKEDKLFKIVKGIIKMQDRKSIWGKRKDGYLKGKDNPTDIIIYELLRN